jgi:hypothetical protein
MNKHKVLHKILALVAILGSSICCFSCIQVADRINPIVKDFLPNAEYSPLDAICISTIFTDNERLDRIVVQVVPNRTTVTAGTVDFTLSQTIKLERGGRRYDQSICVKVPVNPKPGIYDIILTVYDQAGNFAQVSRSTRIVADPVPPQITVPSLEIFKNNAFSRLTPDANGFFVVCQLDELDFGGEVTVSDNQAIRDVNLRLTVVRGNREVDVFTTTTATNNVNTKLVQLKGFFVPPLRIRDTDVENVAIGNGAILRLRLSVTDFNSNSASSQPLNLRVDCDRIKPTISLTRTRPEGDTLKREIFVVEKGSFKILQGRIADNAGLANLNVVFRRQNGTVVSSKDFAVTGKEATLQSILVDNFLIPTNAAINDEFQLVLTVTDISGNQEIYNLRVSIKVDDPPVFTIIKPTVTLDGGTEREILLSTDSANPTIVPLGALRMTIQGKVTDDNFLEYVQMYWAVSSATTNTPLINATNLQELVYDYTQPPLRNVFPFATTRVAQTYVLELRAKDNKVEVSRKFFVRVK